MIITAESLKAQRFKIKKEGKPRKGISTGIPAIDDCMLLNKQMLMILTGYSGKGKTEYLDMLALNSAILHDWHWVFFSPETPFVDHLEKLVEKYVGNRLVSTPDYKIEEAVEFIGKHFTWIKATEKLKPQDIMEEIENHIQMGNKVDAIVYDPWNELDHSEQGAREDQYISAMLTKMRIFHKKYDLLTCIVIHSKTPTKDKDGNVPIPQLYDCTGGIMWSNKADYGIAVHRPSMIEHGADIYFLKVKSKKIGHVGKVHLDYDPISGRYKDETMTGFTLPVPDCPL